MAAKGGAGKALREIAKKAKTFPRQYVDQTVKDIRKAVTKSLKTDTGDGRMSGAGNARLTIKATVKGDSIVTGDVSAGGARGPWTWLEEGTKPHIVGGWYKGAHHPGTRAKRTWSRAVGPALDRATKDAAKRLKLIVHGR